MELSPAQYATAAAAAALVGVSKSGFGGGLGIFALPLMAAAFPQRAALGLLLPLLLVSDVIAVWQFRREFHLGLIRRFLPGTLAGIVLGTWLLDRVSDAGWKQVVGGVCLAFCAVQWGLALLRRSHHPLWHGGWTSSSLFGIASGTTSTIAHAGGPLVTMWLLPLRLAPPTHAGTFCLTFFLINLAKIPAYAAQHLFPRHLWHAALVLAPAAVAGSLLGAWISRRVDAKRYQALLTGLLFLTGLELVSGGTLLRRLLAGIG